MRILRKDTAENFLDFWQTHEGFLMRAASYIRKMGLFPELQPEYLFTVNQKQLSHHLRQIIILV